MRRHRRRRYTLESNGDVPRASGPGQGRDRRGLVVDVLERLDDVDRPLLARRARAGRVAGGSSARRGPRPARQPRVARSRRSSPTKSREIVVYCAGGCPLGVRREVARRARLRRTSSSMAGGFTDWKRNGFDVHDAARADPRAARPLLAPHPHPRGRRGGAAEAARRARAPDRRRRARLAGVALPRGGRRRHARHRRRRRRRRLEPAAPDRPLDEHARRAEGALGEARDRGAQPRRQRGHLRGAAHLRERRAHPRRRLGRDRRRRRQLPDALPRQRRLGLARHPGRPRLDLPLRGPGHGLPPARRARATAASTPPRRRRSSRRAAPRAACSACCPASSARSRRARR